MDIGPVDFDIVKALREMRGNGEEISEDARVTIMEPHAMPKKGGL